MANEPLDHLTLAIIARRTPDATLYSTAVNNPSRVYQEHAACCLADVRYDLRRNREPDLFYRDNPLPGITLQTSRCGWCMHPVDGPNDAKVGVE